MIKVLLKHFPLEEKAILRYYKMLEVTVVFIRYTEKQHW